MHIALVADGPTQTSSEEVARAIGLEAMNASHWTLPAPNRFPIAILVVAGDDSSNIINNNDAGYKEECCACQTVEKQAIARLEQWLALEFFELRLTREYEFVMRLRPDTWIFRRPRFSFVMEMNQHKAFIAHIGENSVQQPPHLPKRCAHVNDALLSHFLMAAGFESGNLDDRAKRALAMFGRLDSAFILVRSSFFTESGVTRRALARLVRSHAEAPHEGMAAVAPTVERTSRRSAGQLFGMHGWDAASLWALALVVSDAAEHRRPSSSSPTEEVLVSRTRIRDLQWMLWQPRVMRRNAVLYHGTSPRPLNEIKQWTRLRWSRVVREKTGF
jgi:hypothetical protein